MRVFATAVLASLFAVVSVQAETLPELQSKCVKSGGVWRFAATTEGYHCQCLGEELCHSSNKSCSNASVVGDFCVPSSNRSPATQSFQDGSTLCSLSGGSRDPKGKEGHQCNCVEEGFVHASSEICSDHLDARRDMCLKVAECVGAQSLANTAPEEEAESESDDFIARVKCVRSGGEWDKEWWFTKCRCNGSTLFHSMSTRCGNLKDEERGDFCVPATKCNNSTVPATQAAVPAPAPRPGVLADPKGVRDELACEDGMDNDRDGLFDANDPGCAGQVQVREDPQCNDGIDNDLDGKIDMEDTNCVISADQTEYPASAVNWKADCNNGRDDDGDSLVDMNDSGCTSVLDLDEREPCYGDGCDVVAVAPSERQSCSSRCQQSPGGVWSKDGDTSYCACQEGYHTNSSDACQCFLNLVIEENSDQTESSFDFDLRGGAFSNYFLFSNDLVDSRGVAVGGVGVLRFNEALEVSARVGVIFAGSKDGPGITVGGEASWFPLWQNRVGVTLGGYHDRIGIVDENSAEVIAGGPAVGAALRFWKERLRLDAVYTPGYLMHKDQGTWNWASGLVRASVILP